MNLKSLFTNPFKKKVGLPEKIEKVDLDYTKSKKWFLSEEQKLMIVKMIAHCMKPLEIQTILKEEHNIKLSKNQIILYAKTEKWKPIIKKLREDYLSKLDEVAGFPVTIRVGVQWQPKLLKYPSFYKPWSKASPLYLV